MSHRSVSPTCFEHAGRTDVGKADDAASTPVPCSCTHRTVWSLDRMKYLSEAITAIQTQLIMHGRESRRTHWLFIVQLDWTEW